ncbi:MAG: cation:proton antiporter [Bacteroidetes bacterium]|nr:cation:proton antiporter [Bacteroidota bacterium]MBS1630402.1 cation:proton antiporter [Bacteroidota bacterium]
MNHIPVLISDLGIILAAAGLTTLLFKWLKQPLVLGYIIAGFLTGPHFTLFPNVADVKNINIWAEIGIIFLLFGLGLEFSFKKLIKVGGTAAITALVGVSTTVIAGYLIGSLLHWSAMDSLFMGGILGISSTAIIIRAFDELGLKTRRFAGIVTGVLVIEDLVAVLLLVLLSTVAVSQSFSGMAMLESLLKLGFFLMLWFLSGVFIIPSFLKRTHKLMNDETLLIVSLALCLIMVMLASKAGFSAALGAFIMGSLLSETFQGARIEHLLTPIRDFFSAIFFVSVGMLIDPKLIAEHYLPIALGVGVLLISKPFFATLGTLISGQPLKTSVRAGMSLSQIGEFSFIIATLGTSLKVTSPFLYPIAVAISVITAFTSPYMIRLSDPVQAYLTKTLPASWMTRLNQYASGAQSIRTVSDWRLLLRNYLLNIAVYSVLLLSIIFLTRRYLQPVLAGYRWGTAVTILAGSLLMTPFLWALAVRRSRHAAFGKLWLKRRFRGPLILLDALRILVAMFFVGMLVAQLLSPFMALIIPVVIIVLLAVFSKSIQTFYTRIETRFISNLNQKELMEQERRRPELAPWDAHISLFEVTAETPLIGRPLIELQLREQYGVNITMIERGSRMIVPPERSEKIYPGDILSVIGTDEQLDRFRQSLVPAGPIPSISKKLQRQEVVLRKLSLLHSSQLLGKSIRESALRERTRGIVVGIERDGARILNPDSGFRFAADDIVWIVGNARRLQVLLQEEQPVAH